MTRSIDAAVCCFKVSDVGFSVRARRCDIFIYLKFVCVCFSCYNACAGGMLRSGDSRVMEKGPVLPF